MCKRNVVILICQSVYLTQNFCVHWQAKTGKAEHSRSPMQ